MSRRTKENAPSRLRLRPAFRLTAAEAAADRRAINLVRSVLGALTTLGQQFARVKHYPEGKTRKLRRYCVCSLNAPRETLGATVARRDSTQKCTEPESPSSDFPTDLRRGDCRSGSHQPWALPARCNWESRRSGGWSQGLGEALSMRFPLFAEFSVRIRRVCTPCSVQHSWRGPEFRRAGCAFVHAPE